MKGLIERNLQQYRFYTSPHTIKGRKKKNICMFITFRRMDGFFEAVHLKRTSVYYKRSKEKWIKKKKTEKNILFLHPQSVYFPISSFLLHGETFWSIVTYEKAAKYQVMTSLKIPRLLNTFFFLSPLFYSFYPILFSFSISSSFPTPSHLFFVFMGYLDSFAQW